MLYHPNFDPIAIELGPIAIHWYGIMYLLGFAAAWWLAQRQTQTAYSPVAAKDVDDLIFYCALGVVLGGRFGYVLFYNFDKFIADPVWLVKVWQGGMSFHGGLLGVFTALLIYAKKLDVPLGRLVNFVVPLVPIGLGLGRIGNFIGQELWGRVSDVPWAMVFFTDPERLPRHPSQLYQAFLEGLVLFVIIYRYSAKQRPDWSVGGLFLICYGFFRVVVEFFRQPDSQIGFDAFGWLTRGQLLSIPMIVAGIVIMIWSYRYYAVPVTAPVEVKNK